MPIMSGAEMENQRMYQNQVLKVLTEIRDNVFSLNKKFEVFATLTDPDFAYQVKKLLNGKDSNSK